MLNPIGLAELIDKIKRELTQSEPSGANSTPLLAIDEVEIEVAVTTTKEASGGLNIQVIALGGGGSYSNVQTVRMKLSPLLSHEERIGLLRQRPDWKKIEGQQQDTLRGQDDKEGHYGPASTDDDR